MDITIGSGPVIAGSIPVGRTMNIKQLPWESCFYFRCFKHKCDRIALGGIVMEIKKTQLPIWWEEVEPMWINHALWGTTYQPECFAKMAYIEKDAIYLNMFVTETNPKAIYTKPQDPVYKDSCMECFLNVNPKQDKYLNIEVNALGTMLVGFGKDRHDRQKIVLENKPFIFKNDRGWGFTLMLEESDVLSLFGEIADHWKANFYKCGDETDPMHFLSWQEVKEEKPNFHCSQWFGELEVK